MNKYYDIRDMVKQYPDARYYISIGEPSDGKVYLTLDMALERFRLTKCEQFVYIRRYKQDIEPKQMSKLFSAHRVDGRIATIFDDEWDRIIFQRGNFYLARFDEDSQKIEHEKYPIGFAYALSDMNRFKSSTFSNATTFIFDEFSSQKGYTKKELEIIQSTFSPIVRQRDNVKIFIF